ncbi:MAG: hypothetical protein ACOX74_05435 [Lachnospiraceae bacterium]
MEDLDADERCSYSLAYASADSFISANNDWLDKIIGQDMSGVWRVQYNIEADWFSDALIIAALSLMSLHIITSSGIKTAVL